MERVSPAGAYPGDDYEWYASDACGHVAAFASAGIGPIPVTVLAARPSADSFAGTVARMTSRGNAILLVRLPKSDDFLRLARCGIFAYDWQDVHRTESLSRRYEMIACPACPIGMNDMPTEMRDLLRATRLASARFADSLTLDVERDLACEMAV